MRIGHHQQFELFEPLHHLCHARNGIAAVAHDDHTLHDVPLIDLVRIGKRRIEPASPRDARQLHILLARASWTASLCWHFIEP